MKQIAALLLRLLLLPFVMLLALLRYCGRVLKVIFRPLLAAIDSSDRLSDLINSLSTLMATQRGLLLMIGTVIVAVSIVVHIVVIAALVATDSFDRTLYWLFLPFVLFHIGVLTGFVGIMLAVPLGQGYKSQQQ